jgi:CheY-like chemotaxis protein
MVLLIDDELTVLYVLSDFFAQHGLHTDCAADLITVRRLLRERHYGVAIADLKLSPEQRDPLELIIELRRLRPQLPVVVFSGCDEPEVRRQALALGVVAFVQKPAPPIELVSLARQALVRP